MLTKEQVADVISQMLDQFEIDDVIDKLIILDKIEKGLDDIKTGNTKGSVGGADKWSYFNDLEA